MIKVCNSTIQCSIVYTYSLYCMPALTLSVHASSVACMLPISASVNLFLRSCRLVDQIDACVMLGYVLNESFFRIKLPE